MQRAVIASLVALLAGPVYGQTTTAKPHQEPSFDAVFRAGVDLVTVSATVRDRHGRSVADLTAQDFEVLDRGVRRPITDFRTEAMPISVAILFDVSGSMDVASRSLAAKFAANHVLSWLEHGRDEAALFAFDSRLHEVAPFTVDTRALQGALGEVDPFGATSLHDAIADTAKRIAERANKRRAIVAHSMMGGDLPEGRRHFADNLHLGGAFQDNRIVPYEGLKGAELGATQRRDLMDLVGNYLAPLPPGPLAARLAEVERHLAETHFCWIGGFSEESPFYYRIQSPVTFIEFDHHAGVFLTNPEPAKFHVHTIVRTPNGNDYGIDLLRQHYRRSPHHGGGHKHEPHGQHRHEHGSQHKSVSFCRHGVQRDRLTLVHRCGRAQFLSASWQHGEGRGGRPFGHGLNGLHRDSAVSGRGL